jgi:predicted protein tyrosine phosphatase
MHLLFVCSRNQWRSPTAEALYRNHSEYQARSAGTASSARIRLSAKLIQWADIIFVMEHRHKQIVQQQFNNELSGKRLIVLDIADEYTYMDPELIEMIRSRVDSELNSI